MEIIYTIAKYSILLLLISNACINGETDDVLKTDSDVQHSQDVIQNKDADTNHVIDDIGLKRSHAEHSEDFQNNEVCDKEKEVCSANKDTRSPSVKQEAAQVSRHEEKFETDTGSEEHVLVVEKSDKIETSLHKIEDISKEHKADQSEDNAERSEIINKESVETERDINDETSDNAQAQALNNESVKNVSTSESNSTIYQWLKFILDPFIEEFKDGIYPKISDKTNVTSSNVSVINQNTTVETETVNVTLTEPANLTESENNTTEAGKKVKFHCTGKNVTDSVNATVKLITTAQLLQLLNFDKNDTDNVTDCLLVMFYAPWCHFCAKVAPHYNALARAFPQLDFVAVDTAQFSNLLARFGTVSVPNILVFHQSRAAVKFNQTERTFDNFVTFVTNSTGLEPNSTVNVTDADYLGPVPSVPTNEPDYLLLISWIFVIFCSSCMFIKSNKGQQWINRVRILWQEHQHID